MPVVPAGEFCRWRWAWFFSACPHSHKAHWYSEPTLPCLHSRMELLQQIQLWKHCLVQPQPQGFIQPDLCPCSAKASPLHPSQLQILIFLLGLPAQPQQGCFLCIGIFSLYRDVFPVAAACSRLRCLPHKSQQQYSRAINDSG